MGVRRKLLASHSAPRSSWRRAPSRSVHVSFIRTPACTLASLVQRQRRGLRSLRRVVATSSTRPLADGISVARTTMVLCRTFAANAETTRVLVPFATAAAGEDMRAERVFGVHVPPATSDQRAVASPLAAEPSANLA